MTYKESDFEGKFNLSRTFENQVVVPGKNPRDPEIVYIGNAIKLFFDGTEDIRGQATLKKYHRWKRTRKKRKLQSIIPLRFKVEEKTRFRWKNIWELFTESESLYFIYRSRIHSQYKRSSGYRGALASEAANQDIQLKEKLFDAVFNPIDEKLMQMLRAYKEGMEK